MIDSSGAMPVPCASIIRFCLLPPFISGKCRILAYGANCVLISTVFIFSADVRNSVQKPGDSFFGRRVSPNTNFKVFVKFFPFSNGSALRE